MDPERWRRIEHIYSRVLELEPGKSAGYIEDACEDDDELRKEVERLLTRRSDAERFIESPAIEVAARALAKDQDSSSDKDLTGSMLSH